MTKCLNRLTGKEALQFVSKIEKFFSGVPHLPKGLVKFFVTVTPWLVGLSGLVNLLGGISAIASPKRFMFSSYMINFDFWQMNPMYYTAMGVYEIVVGLLLLMAFTPLRSRKSKGWMYLFWVMALGVVEMIIGVFFGYRGVIGSLVGMLIGFYVLFELKPSYFDSKTKGKKQKSKK